MPTFATITAPLDANSVNLGFGVASVTGTPTAVMPRLVNSSEISGEGVRSGALAVAAQTLHDDADAAAEGPVKIGGVASAAAPSSVSADGDRVAAWLLRNGAQATVITAAGALIGGDASNGLDVDVTRVPTDPFGANADAASATGSISAKLRFIAATGIPVTGTVTIAGAVTNAGTFVTQENGAALTSLQLIDDVIFTDDNAFTPAASKVAMAGFEADESSTDSVDEGDAGAGRMTLDRKIIVTPQPHSAGGLSTLNATSSDGGTALTSTAQVIKASAGQVYGWAIHNPNDETCYVNFYNTAAASVTVGTTNPLFQFPIPAGASANLIGAHGIVFSNAGFSISATKTAGSSTAPDVALEAAIFYS